MATQSQDPNWQKAQKARLEEYHRQRKAGAFDKGKAEEERKATMQTVKSKGSKFLTGDYTKGTTQVGREDPTSQWSEPTSPTEAPQVQTDLKRTEQPGGDQTPGEMAGQQGVQDLSVGVTGVEEGTVQRDFEREQEALKKMGLDPLSVQNMDPKKLLEMTYTPEELAGMADYQKLVDYENAKQTMENTPQPNNTMMAALEDALRMKSDPAKQPLGVSQMYEQAGIPTKGVSGYATLMQSLNNQNKIMNDNYQNFTSKLSKTGGAMADAYQAVAEKYELHLDEIERINKRYDMALQNAFQTEQAMKLLEKQNELDKDTAKWAASQNVGEGITGLSPGQNSQLAGVFQLSGKSEYRESGFECAEASNKLVDGSHLGSDYYKEKMPHVKKRDNPQVGNQLVIPWGHKDFGGSNSYGHAETVIGVNGDNIYTVSWNRNGDGAQTFETHDINDLKSKYGDKWGLTNSTLKNEYQQGLGEILGTPEERIAEKDYDSSPDWFQGLMDEYVKGNYSDGNIRAKIGRMPGLSDEEKDGYKALLDNMLDQKVPESQGSDSPQAKLWDVFGAITGGSNEGLSWKEMRDRNIEKQSVKESYDASKQKKGWAEKEKYETTRKSLLKLSPNEIKEELKIKYEEDDLSDDQIEEMYKKLVAKYNLT